MNKPSTILGRLDICDSNKQGWSESYYMKTADFDHAKGVFLTLCRYRAACLASEYSLVSSRLEISNGLRQPITVVDRPMSAEWTKKVLPLLTTMNVAIECRFQTEKGRNINCFFHALGRFGSRTNFSNAIQETYDNGSVPSPDELTCPEDGFRAFLAFLRDNTIYARTNKANRVLDTTPWKSVSVKGINLDVDLELSSVEKKKDTDMLPIMTSLNRCKTLKVVRVGPLQLFFELYRQHQAIPSSIVGFIVDGQAPCVCERAGNRVRTDKYLSFIEPDKSKWLPESEFAKKWLETSKMFMGMAGTLR